MPASSPSDCKLEVLATNVQLDGRAIRRGTCCAGDRGVEAMATQSVTPRTGVNMRRIIRQSFHGMSPVERRRTLAMYGSILLLHALGFFVFIVYVLPAHYKLF